MEPSRKLFPLAFLLLLLVATEMAPVVVQARECEMQSNAFRGMCMWDANCASVCRTEGFPSGKCSGFRRRCFCTKQCT